MSGRIYNQQFSNVANSFLDEVGDDLTTSLGKEVKVYKFRKVSGNIKFTNFGEKSLFDNNDDFQQTLNVYTGKEPIIVVWDNSTTLNVNTQDKIIKNCKVGTYYKLYDNASYDNNLNIDNIDILNKTYVSSYANKEITLTSFGWEPNDNDMLDYVYLVLDPRDKSNQWLEITSINKAFHQTTKKFLSANITFENINLKYSKTGKSLIDFLQFGAIGEGYAFPVEENDNVRLDTNKLLKLNEGVNNIQYDFNNGVGNMDFMFIGRAKEKLLEDGAIEIDKPHFLFPVKVNSPKKGTFFYNTPNLNSYFVQNAKPTKVGIWNSYKEAYKSNSRIGEYNIDKQKSVLVGFQIDTTQVRNSNPDIGTYNNFDNKKWIEMNKTFSSDGLKALSYVRKETTSIRRNVDISTLFTSNWFINQNLECLSFDYRELTKVKIEDTLGVLGSLFSLLVGGLDIGTTWGNDTFTASSIVDFIIPCISFEDGIAALSDQAPLPSDIFIDDSLEKVLPTATNVLTSWNFSLTEHFQDTTIIGKNAIDEIGKGKNGIWNTKYLGQKKDENGSYLLTSGEPLLLNLETFNPYLFEEKEYIIDYEFNKTIGICDYRISAYNSKNEMIYNLYTETNSKARGELTIIQNQTKFNYYEEFNVNGNVKYPEEVLPPVNENLNKEFIIDELKNYDYSTWSWNELLRYYDRNNTNESAGFNGVCVRNDWDAPAFLGFNRNVVWEIQKNSQNVDYIENSREEIRTEEISLNTLTWSNFLQYQKMKITFSNGVIKEFDIQPEQEVVLDNLDFWHNVSEQWVVRADAGLIGEPTNIFSDNNGNALQIRRQIKSISITAIRENNNTKLILKVKFSKVILNLIKKLVYACIPNFGCHYVENATPYYHLPGVPETFGSFNVKTADFEKQLISGAILIKN